MALVETFVQKKPLNIGERLRISIEPNDPIGLNPWISFQKIFSEYFRLAY